MSPNRKLIGTAALTAVALAVGSAAVMPASANPVDLKLRFTASISFDAVKQTRIFDTRDSVLRTKFTSAIPKGTKTFADSGQMAAGRTLLLDVHKALKEIAPDSALADEIVLNVTVVGGDKPGYVSVAANSASLPEEGGRYVVNGTSVVNFAPGEINSNGAIIASSWDRDPRPLRLYTHSTAHVIVDLLGYFRKGALGRHWTGMTRWRDTRKGTSDEYKRLRAGETREWYGSDFDSCAAVVFNVTAVNPASDGFVTLYTAGEPQPKTSSLNFKKGKNAANTVYVKPDNNGKFMVYSMSSTDLILDEVGCFPYSSKGPTGSVADTLTFNSPVRVFDSREPNDTNTSAQMRRIKVAGVSGLPRNTNMVMANVTVTEVTEQGFLTAGPQLKVPVTTSQINYVPGDTKANNMPVALDSAGFMTIYTHGAADVIVDITGYTISGETPT